MWYNGDAGGGEHPERGYLCRHNTAPNSIIAESCEIFKMRMRKKKHSAERIGACAELLIQDPLSFGGNAAAVFADKKPLLLEIGCGKGDFAVGLSAKFPEYNIIALERVPDVAMFALEKAMATRDNRLDNLRFIIGNAEYLYDWFAPSTFDRVYINFCDPWPKARHAKRRLPSRQFLQRFKLILKDDGVIEFKTDNNDLFDFALEEIEPGGFVAAAVTRDLHNDEKMNEGNIMTEYEEKFSSRGNNINKYILKKA